VGRPGLALSRGGEQLRLTGGCSSASWRKCPKVIVHLSQEWGWVLSSEAAEACLTLAKICTLLKWTKNDIFKEMETLA
jgi:hypothetical protein